MLNCEKCPVRHKCESEKTEHLLPLVTAKEKLLKICPLELAVGFQVGVLKVRVDQMQKKKKEGGLES